MSGGQSQTILRVLFGALAEAWETVKRPVNQKLIGSDYIKSIDPEGVAAYADLKRHFGKSNLLHKLRNGIAVSYTHLCAFVNSQTGPLSDHIAKPIALRTRFSSTRKYSSSSGVIMRACMVQMRMG